MLANIISQTLIDEVIGNSEDSLPNKIKEKEESLQNTLNNRLNIPMVMQKQAPLNTINENKVEENEPEYEYKNEEVTHEIANENMLVDNQKEYDLVDFLDKNLLNGNDKPINVKEHMILKILVILCLDMVE